MSMLCTCIRGANVQHFFQSGGKCPPLSITWRANVLVYHFFHRVFIGGQMSEGGNVLHSSSCVALFI